MGLPASNFDSEPSGGTFAPNDHSPGFSKINESPVPFPKGGMGMHEEPPF
jgi:replicative DNA helicase